jgi:hypothetical protein
MLDLVAYFVMVNYGITIANLQLGFCRNCASRVMDDKTFHRSTTADASLFSIYPGIFLLRSTDIYSLQVKEHDCVLALPARLCQPSLHGRRNSKKDGHSDQSCSLLHTMHDGLRA